MAILLIPLAMAATLILVLVQQEQVPQIELIETIEYPQKGVTCYLYKHNHISCVKTEETK